MKILLIDRHELFRAGLKCMLQKLPNGVNEVLEADDWKEGLKCVEQHSDLKLVLLEHRAHGCNGSHSIKFFHEHYPDIPLVVVSSEEEFHVINNLLNNGAKGFVGKSSSEAAFLSAVELVLAGSIYVPPQMLKHPSNLREYRLTPRQMQMLTCLTEGLSNKKISEKLGLAEGTVKVHVAAVYQTLRVRNRREAAGVASQIGLVGKRYGKSLRGERPI
jgi:DNA-binding NarL/FixJ family response regulator